MMMREAESPESALTALAHEAPADVKAAFQWASAVRKAAVYLLSGLEMEIAEELFTIPLAHGGEVNRLLRGNGTYALIADAHKTMAVVKGK
jgi:hypothetical protein